MEILDARDANHVYFPDDLSDLDSETHISEGGGGGSLISNDGSAPDMSVCLEPNSVLTSQVSTNHAPTITEVPASSPRGNDNHIEKVPVAKIIVANNQAIQSTLSGKVVNPPLITVMNTPITVVKTLSSTTPSHFTLVNSAVKSPTITLVNAPPITVVKSIPSENMKPVENISLGTNNGSINNGSLGSVSEKAVHNVFVKKSIAELGQDIPQSHKILTANSFPTNNVVQNLAHAIPKTVNGQKPITQSKVKILSNVVMSTGMAGPSNLLLNKTERMYFQPQKVPNNGTPKYMNKTPPNNIIKNAVCPTKPFAEKMPQRLLYSAHKPPYKTIPSMANYAPKPVGIKTLSPQGKGVPGQVQRTSSGLRTIPPQRPPKPANKTNYIGKHAVQAQKLRPPHIPPKIKNVKHPSPINSYHPRLPQQSSQVTFNQALTAQILETLGQDSSKSSSYETSRYDTFNYMENKLPPEPPVIPRQEYKPQSNLDTLSFVCQAVLLDHNYNATLPAELPPAPTITSPPQINGVPGGSMYSPGTVKRGRTTSLSASVASSIPVAPLLPSNGSNIPVQDDDAASDISCVSDRKLDTEGEETDTAPEAEAVANDDPADRYGDYVTRCICGFIHDDGYMIECDKCKVWQHVRCVIKSKKVPDDYLCEVCDPSKQMDRQKARTLQQQWMREIQDREARLRKEQMKDAMTDTDSSDGEMVPNNNNMSTKGRRKSDGNRQVRQRRDSNKDVQVPRKPLKRKERKVVRRKLKSHNKSHSDDEKRDHPPSQLPQLRQWIDNYEEAVTNHYSPELRARISNIRINGAHSELTGQIDPSVHKCKVQNLGAGIKCLVSTVHLPSGVPVVELRGKYMLSTQHRTAHGGSLTTRQQRPGPFLFFYRLHRDNTEVCVDTRTYGNSARFVRRSCQPNAELRHCIEKGVLHLYIVTTAPVDKNLELTIKHESHDLAVVGSTEIPCACGNGERCSVNRIKKNGEALTIDVGHRKRRARRTMSVCAESSLSPVKPKEEPILPEIKQEKEDLEIEKPKPKDIKDIKDVKDIKVKEEVLEETKPVKEEPEPVEVKKEPEDLPVKEELIIKEEPPEEKPEEPEPKKIEVVKSPPPPPPVEVKEKEPPPPPPQPVNTRRASAAQKAAAQEAAEEKMDKLEPQSQEEDKKDKKLSREERKLQAIMKAIERMERQEQRKQEHQAKQAHRRESEPSPNTRDEDKCPSRPKRRKRKGRARTVSTNSQSGRRNRLDSADSQQATSSDEPLLSPSDNTIDHGSPSKAAGLLLSLSGSDNLSCKDMDVKSPERVRDLDSNSNSAHSSPETPLSSACLLVAAAVEPMEPGFKFPKTKKGLMNEWLNKSPEVVQPASQISPSSLTPHIQPTSVDGAMYDNNTGFYAPGKNLVALAQAASFCDSPSQPSQGSAKKRWLRQAISEDQCDSPCSRPESPPMSDSIAPPKKRRLPRESISTDGTPPTTPTRVSPPLMPFRLASERKTEETIKSDQSNDDSVSKSDFRTPPLSCFTSELTEMAPTSFSSIKDVIRKEIIGIPTPLSDPRLGRDRSLFTTGEQLVGTVEKTLSFLGFEDKKPETITPTKRKLSITEYLQRKKVTSSDKSDDQNCMEENNCTMSQSPKPIRNRSNSSSSNTSMGSSDDDTPLIDLPRKAVSAFNSEPTELERQRENVSLRVKKALGIALDENSRNPALAVSSLLKADLQPLSIKTTLPLQSPTFPIPGSASEPTPRTTSPETPTQSAYIQSTAPLSSVKKPELKEGNTSTSNPVMYYTPDEEEAAPGPASVEEGKFLEKPETTSYVPPFNNPLYPNSSYTTYGSVIDDDVPYEGRNPSPPPNLGGVQ